MFGGPPIAPEPHRRGGEIVTVGLLVAAMAAALLPIVGIGVLSSDILADLEINRTQLGLAITAASGMSAVAAIALGRFTDRQGGRNGLVTVFALAGVAAVGIAAAPTFLFLILAAAVAGLAMGSANPATNRLIVETIARGRWGTITGVKQSGEAITMVLGGLLLPSAAIVIGWRLAFAIAAIVPAVAIAVVIATIPGRPARPATTTTARPRPLDANIRWLAAYSLFVGLCAGTIATYLPLYAQEGLGMSAAAAGLVMAAMGTVAVAGRIGWGHFARGVSDLRSRMLTVALLSIVAIVVLWSASALRADLVWLGAAVWGISILSVGALGNLAVMVHSVAENTGRASGVMLTGFGIGLMIGAPVFGWTVDTTGAYDVGFGLLLAEVSSLTVIAVGWARAPRPKHDERFGIEPAIEIALHGGGPGSAGPASGG